MRQKTGKFRQVEEAIDVCDWCKKELTDDNHIIWDETDYRYEEEYGISFEVCSLDCLIAYLNNEHILSPTNESLKLFVPAKKVSALISLFLEKVK